MANPQNRPIIPSYIASEDVVFIVDFETRNNDMHLFDSTIRRTVLNRQGNEIVSVQAFLLRSNGKAEWVFGRQLNGKKTVKPDVYLPDFNGAPEQFKLVPNWETNSWRIHALSETVCTVNGVPLQKPSTRTRRPGHALPHVLYLDQNGSSHVAVRHVQMDIWLMKTPREVITSEHEQADRVDLSLQDVSTRNEEWAQSQYIRTGTQVSNQTHAVRQIFTGKVMAAKTFNDRNRRDVEFVMFNKAQLDASIVRYLQSTDIGAIAAVITDLYEGCQSYASIRDTLRAMHPGLRFEAATKLTRRLFAALESTHSQHIVHGNITHDSVLVRIVNDRLEQVLLVNYSLAQPFSPGDIAPTEAMIADGKTVIQLVDDVCDIWTLRNAPTPNARSDTVMRKRNRDAAEKFETIERCFHDYVNVQGHSAASEKGKRILELCMASRFEWDRTQQELIANTKLKEVGNLSRPALDDIRNEYGKTHGLGTGIHWILSLGHPFVDGLITQLYHEKWDLTPHEICEKIREIAGTVEEPWQTFDVTLTFVFEEEDRPTDLPATDLPATNLPATNLPAIDPPATDPTATDPPVAQNLVALAIQPILSWLAASCDIYPEWSPILQTELANTIRSTESGVNRDELNNLRRALSEHGTLPSSLQKVFEYLLGLYNTPSQDTYTIDVDYKVWYHQPSRMFNATQLQHLASPEDMRACIAERRTTCDNFAEVRGNPEVEGCYVPMALLPLFIAGLRLTVRNLPDTSIDRMTFNPSDFSQVRHQYRVILARRGLLGYASILRTRDQCGWVDKPKSASDIETPAIFLPTYFGDVEVFPDLPNHSRHPLPDHWAQYVPATSTQQQPGGESPESGRESPESGLSGLLRQRENVRAAAFRGDIGSVEPATDPAGPATNPAGPATRSVHSKTTASQNTTASAPGGETQRSDDSANPRQTRKSSGETQRSADSVSTRQTRKSSGSRVSSLIQQYAPSLRQDYDDGTTVVDVGPVVDGDWEKTERWLAEDAASAKKRRRGIFLVSGLVSPTEADLGSPTGKLSKRNLAGSSTEVDPNSPPANRGRGNSDLYASPTPPPQSPRRRTEESETLSMPDTDPGDWGSQELGNLPDADDTPS